MIFALTDCEIKINMLSAFFLKIAQLLPTSPMIFRIQYLLDAINGSTPWGLGGVILELLSGIIDYIKLVVAWKFVKLLINVLGAKM